MSVLDESYRVAWGDLVFIKENLLEVVLSSAIGPLLYLLAFGYGIGGSIGGGQDYIRFIIPGIIALTTLSACFSNISMKILVQRMFYMSFDEILLCPIHISALVLGKTYAGIIRALITCTIILVVGKLIAPDLEISPLIYVLILAGSLTFSLLGLLAGMLSSKTNTLNLFSSIVIIPMTFLCGTLFDTDALPSWAATVIDLLPLTQVSELMRGVMIGPMDGSLILPAIILAAYMVGLFSVCYWLIRTNRCD